MGADVRIAGEQHGAPERTVLDGLRQLLELCFASSRIRLARPRVEMNVIHIELYAVSEALAPLLDRFRIALRSTGTARRSRGAPRASRRAVTAAIDRVCDAFLAIDADSGRVVDANPAAGALLGLARDALLDVEASAFIEAGAQESWSTALEAMTEGAEKRGPPARLDAGPRKIKLGAFRPGTTPPAIPTESRSQDRPAVPPPAPAPGDDPGLRRRREMLERLKRWALPDRG